MKPGASVSRVARDHDVNTNQVFKWRRLHERGLLGAGRKAVPMLPVRIEDPALSPGRVVVQGPEVETQPAREVKARVDGDRTARRPGHGARCSRSRGAARGHHDAAAMIALPPGARIWLAAGVTDMRKGFGGLAALVQETLAENAFSGQMFVFRGRRGDLVKLLWWSGDGMNLYAKRLERGRFVWPQARSGAVHLTSAQLSMLFEGIDWRRPTRTWQPERAA